MDRRRDSGGKRAAAAPARNALLAVAAGGAMGAPVRVEVSRLLVTVPGTFPWTTFAINLVGSALLGALMVGLVERRAGHPLLRPLLATGFLGAFTTFSALSVEADLLARGHHLGAAVGYLTASLAGGMLAVAIGTGVARRAWGQARALRAGDR